MFSYNKETQSYNFSLIEDEKKSPKIDPKMQEIVRISDFKILQEAEFHDLWFCEYDYCEKSFWLGGKHHCRMCGNSICSDHCMENVVLSTRSLPVLIDKLPNATRPILAASKDNLPETLEFKRACLKCCNNAKVLPIIQKSTEDLQHEKEIRRAKRNERKKIEQDNHWSNDNELIDKIHKMKSKKESRRPRKNVDVNNIISNSPTENIETTVQTNLDINNNVSILNKDDIQNKTQDNTQNNKQKTNSNINKSVNKKSIISHPTTTAVPIKQQPALLTPQRDPSYGMKTTQAIRAEELLHVLQSSGESASKGNSEQQSKALDLLQRASEQLSKARYSHTTNILQDKQKGIDTEISCAESKSFEITDVVQVSDTIVPEIVAAADDVFHQEEMSVDCLDIPSNTSSSNILLSSVFRTAQATNDETAIQAAAADIIAHAWHAYVADRRRRALLQKQRVFLERISACRIQSWIRVKLAHLQFIARRRLREAIAEAEAQALVAQQAAMIQIRRLSRVFLAYFAKRRLRQRLYKLPRVVVVDKIAVGVSYASQQVIVSRQSGCTGIESLAGSARNAVVARSKAAVLFKTKEDVFASNTVCHERCLLTGVTADSTLCVTLLNPTSFVQSLVSVRDHMSKLSTGRTVTVSPLPVETVLAPTLDSSGKSAIPPNLGTTPDDHPGLRYLTLKAAPYVSSHAGYVFKQTHSLKGDFKERYLVLLEGKLCFFKDALSLHEPKGSLLCASIKVFKFGHDKSSEGKLTVFLSDGKEEWHLRFPNTDRHTSSVECRTWLRKIQYACPQTRLNGCTELGFVELLERMGRTEEAPVLRPSTQGKVLTSVFGSLLHSNRAIPVTTHSSSTEANQASTNQQQLHVTASPVTSTSEQTTQQHQNDTQELKPHTENNSISPQEASESPISVSCVSTNNTSLVVTESHPPATEALSPPEPASLGIESPDRDVSEPVPIVIPAAPVRVKPALPIRPLPDMTEFLQIAPSINRTIQMWNARLIMRRRLEQLPHVLVVDNIQCSVVHSTQYVILHTFQKPDLSTTILQQRPASLIQSLYCTEDLPLGTSQESCLLSNIKPDTVVCATLIKPNAFVQSIISMKDIKTLYSYQPVTVTAPVIESNTVPVVDQQGNPLIPANVGSAPTPGAGFRNMTFRLVPHTFSQSGWLLKQAHSVVGEFKPRYFVLVEGQLQYFSDTLSLHAPKGSIRCADVSVFEYGHDKSAQGELTIRLVAGVEDWYLRFPKETKITLIRTWLRKLQYACPHASLNFCPLPFLDVLGYIHSSSALPILRPSSTTQRFSGMYNLALSIGSSPGKHTTVPLSVRNKKSREMRASQGSNNDTSTELDDHRTAEYAQTMPAVRYMLASWLAKRQFCIKISSLPRVLYIQNITTYTPCYHQQVIIHVMKNTNIHKTGFSTKQLEYEEGKIFPEDCLLAGACQNDSICLTLLKPNSFIQYVIPLHKYPELFLCGMNTLFLASLIPETTLIPVLDAAGRSMIPDNVGTVPENVPGLVSLTLKVVSHTFSQSGWLLKQAHSVVGEFKPRYFVLVEGQLQYFSDTLSLHAPKGSLRCDDVSVFEYGHDKSAQGELTIRLVAGAEDWYLRFPKDCDQLMISAWLRKLQYACPQAPMNSVDVDFTGLLEYVSFPTPVPILRPSSVRVFSGLYSPLRDSLATYSAATAEDEDCSPRTNSKSADSSPMPKTSRISFKPILRLANRNSVFGPSHQQNKNITTSVAEMAMENNETTVGFTDESAPYAQSMVAVRRMVLYWRARHQYRRLLSSHKHILLIDSITTHSKHSTQQVIISQQCGLQKLYELSATTEDYKHILSHSTAPTVYCTQPLTYSAGKTFPDRCILTNIHKEDALAVTLIKSNSFVQSVLLLDKYPTLLKGVPVSVTDFASACTLVPVLDAAGRSMIPENVGVVPEEDPGLASLTLKLAPHTFSQSGWLLKQAHSVVGEFKPRYFVLVEGQLQYFSDTLSLHVPKGSLRCADVSVFEYGHDKSAQGELTIRLVAGAEDWYLRFSKETSWREAGLWLRKLQYACPQVRANNVALSYVELIESLGDADRVPAIRFPQSTSRRLSGLYSPIKSARNLLSTANKDLNTTTEILAAEDNVAVEHDEDVPIEDSNTMERTSLRSADLNSSIASPSGVRVGDDGSSIGGRRMTLKSMKKLVSHILPGDKPFTTSENQDQEIEMEEARATEEWKQLNKRKWLTLLPLSHPHKDKTEGPDKAEHLCIPPVSPYGTYTELGLGDLSDNTAEYAETMPAVRRMLRTWLIRHRLAKLPRVLIVTNIHSTELCSSQHVIIHLQRGLKDWASTLPSQRKALLAHSKAEVLFCTPPLEAQDGQIFPDRAILSSVQSDDVLCVTLIKSNSYIQSIISLEQYSELYHGKTVQINSLEPQCWSIPVLDAAGRSMIPSNVGTVPEDRTGIASLALRFAPLAVSQSGWLLKQAHSVVGEFKPRYFVLVEGQLQYFSDTLSLHAPKGSLRCADVSVFEYGHDKSAQGELTIRLVAGTEDWYLRFPKDCDQLMISAWLCKLQYACVHAPMNGWETETLKHSQDPSTLPILRPSSSVIIGSFYSRSARGSDTVPLTENGSRSSTLTSDLYAQSMPAVRRMLCTWLRRHRQQHIVLIENLSTAETHSSVQVTHFIIHAITSVEDVRTHNHAAEALYRTSKMEFNSTTDIPGRCLIAGARRSSVLCVTLLKPTSFSQFLVPLSSYSQLFHGKAVCLKEFSAVHSSIPVLDAAGRSMIPENVGVAPEEEPGLASLTLKLAPHTFSQSGWLLKQAHSVVGEFKARYFVLVEGQLQYFSDTLSLHAAKGSLRCADVSVFEYGHDKSTQGELTIRLVAGAEDWFLRFPKDCDQIMISAWLRKLQYACPQTPVNGSVLPLAERVDCFNGDEIAAEVHSPRASRRLTSFYSPKPKEKGAEPIPQEGVEADAVQEEKHNKGRRLSFESVAHWTKALLPHHQQKQQQQPEIDDMAGETVHENEDESQQAMQGVSTDSAVAAEDIGVVVEEGAETCSMSSELVQPRSERSIIALEAESEPQQGDGDTAVQDTIEPEETDKTKAEMPVEKDPADGVQDSKTVGSKRSSFHSILSWGKSLLPLHRHSDNHNQPADENRETMAVNTTTAVADSEPMPELEVLHDTTSTIHSVDDAVIDTVVSAEDSASGDIETAATAEEHTTKKKSSKRRLSLKNVTNWGKSLFPSTAGISAQKSQAARPGSTDHINEVAEANNLPLATSADSEDSVPSTPTKLKPQPKSTSSEALNSSEQKDSIASRTSTPYAPSATQLLARRELSASSESNKERNSEDSSDWSAVDEQDPLILEIAAEEAAARQAEQREIDALAVPEVQEETAMAVESAERAAAIASVLEHAAADTTSLLTEVNTLHDTDVETQDETTTSKVVESKDQEPTAATDATAITSAAVESKDEEPTALTDATAITSAAVESKDEEPTALTDATAITSTAVESKEHEEHLPTAAQHRQEGSGSTPQDELNTASTAVNAVDEAVDKLDEEEKDQNDETAVQQQETTPSGGAAAGKKKKPKKKKGGKK